MSETTSPGRDAGAAPTGRTQVPPPRQGARRRGHRPARRPAHRRATVALLRRWAAAVLLWATLPVGAPAAEDDRVAAPRPSLAVAVVRPTPATLPLRVTAHGSIAAWQEASVGSEAGGLRLAEVRVNVGDVVRRGQVLAVFAAGTVDAELAMARATRAEAEAMLAEAQANAERARDLRASGTLSAQQIAQYLTAERTAAARVQAQLAAERMHELRLAQARVLAPDDGVISARGATVGAVVPPGAELFRLIRARRLEWRAEVPAADLAQLRPGQPVRVTPVGGETLNGQVRVVGPTVDAATRNGLVYVDLLQPGAARAGMFARGEIELGSVTAMTLPASALQLKDGFHVVMRVDPEGRVRQTKVAAGRRDAERVEITGGLDASARVVEKGAAFLADGDLVRIVSR